MGEVYAAEDLELRTRVAVKTIRVDIAKDDEAMRRFRHEVLLARRVTHPGVCRIFDLGLHHDAGGDLHFITMELLEGETLSSKLRRVGRLGEDEATRVLLQIAEALGAAHRAGVLHRDLKSDNIFLVAEDGDAPKVVVTDFGLATRIDRLDSQRDTQPGQLMGTPAYMSPEQVEGKELTAASDVYALGVVLYEMLTGSLPFTGETTAAMAIQRLTQDVRSPRCVVPSLDVAWEHLTLKALARHPEDRFASTSEILEALGTRGPSRTSPSRAALNPRGGNRILSFVPSHLGLLLARRKHSPRLPHVERLSAAVLFSDITGFTALTERLQRRGHHGAEEIAEIVGRAFEPSIDSIGSWGGSIVSFGGDALLAVFTGANGVRRARAAAEEIRDCFTANVEIVTSDGPAALRVSQGIHYGRVEFYHLGRDGQRLYLVAGDGVHELLQQEHDAIAGAIRLSVEAEKHVAKEGRPKRGDAMPLPATGGLDRLAIDYLPATLRPLLNTFSGEYRSVVLLFFETSRHDRDALQSFSVTLLDILERNGGALLKTDPGEDGTRWLVAFGFPSSHEDDADRAADAALRILAAGREATLQVRGGLHHGTVASVVMGNDLRRTLDVMGDVVNTCARTLSCAAWGEVLCTSTVARQLARIATEDRGLREMKGKSSPVELAALTERQMIPSRHRLQAPFVGRHRELARLRDRLDAAKGGNGLTIGLRGEPGIGKSRLKREISLIARDLGFEVHEGRAISFGGMSYWAVAEMLASALGIRHLHSGVRAGDEVLDRVSDEARRLRLCATDRHHLAEVLGARFPKSPIVHLDPRSIRLNNNIALCSYLMARGKETPLLLLLEDMHWADDMTRDAVTWLAKDLGSSRAVLVLLYRPDYQPPPKVQEEVVGALTPDEIADLVRAHLGQVPPVLGAMISAQAEGNPFYVEEVIRFLLEAGVLGLADEGYVLTRAVNIEDIPPTIQSVIATRLDRLSDGTRQVAQLASVVGRSFYVELLRSFPQFAPHVAAAIEELLARELIFEIAGRARKEYIFKHALTREVTYASILVARRRPLHAAVATALESAFTDDRDIFLPMIAHHREQAGDTARARVCYLEAARVAANRHSHEEAARLVRGYLKLVEGPTPESIAARHMLASSLDVVGQTSAAWEEHLKARDEARALGDDALLAKSLWHLGVLERERGRLAEAEALLDEARTICHGLEAPDAEGNVLRSLANVLVHLGRMEEAAALYAQALEQTRATGSRHAESVVLGAIGGLAIEGGDLEAARPLLEQAIAIKRELGDEGGAALTLGNLGALHFRQGRFDEAREVYLEVLGFKRSSGDRRGQALILGNLAALDLEQGNLQEALQGFQQARAIHREIESRRVEGIIAANVGETLLELNRLDEALEALEQALGIHRAVGNRRSEANTLTGIAEVHRRFGHTAEARACLDTALTIRRETGTRRDEAIVLRAMATLDRHDGDVVAAERRALDAVSILREVGDPHELAVALCTCGHVAIAAGSTARGPLDEAERLATELRVPSASRLRRLIARLQRAQRAFDAGEHGELWQGEHRDDVPAAVRTVPPLDR